MFRQNAGQPKAPSDLVKLKNGSEYPLFQVTIVMLKINDLLKENPVLLLDLALKCRNPEKDIFSPLNSKRLEDLRLIEQGKVKDIIRDVVLSAVSEDLAFSSPFEESPSNKLKF